MRPLILVFAAAGLIATLAACVTPSQRVETYACYWLSNEGAGWVARPDLATEADCYQMDSCSGGWGASGGGCYKWATGRDAPARPWSPDLPQAPAETGDE